MALGRHCCRRRGSGRCHATQPRARESLWPIRQGARGDAAVRSAAGLARGVPVTSSAERTRRREKRSAGASSACRTAASTGSAPTAQTPQGPAASRDYLATSLESRASEGGLSGKDLMRDRV